MQKIINLNIIFQGGPKLLLRVKCLHNTLQIRSTAIFLCSNRVISTTGQMKPSKCVSQQGVFHYMKTSYGVLRDFARVFGCNIIAIIIAYRNIFLKRVDAKNKHVSIVLQNFREICNVLYWNYRKIVGLLFLVHFIEYDYDNWTYYLIEYYLKYFNDTAGIAAEAYDLKTLFVCLTNIVCNNVINNNFLKTIFINHAQF
jgi:hypothetical protein